MNPLICHPGLNSSQLVICAPAFRVGTVSKDPSPHCDRSFKTSRHGRTRELSTKLVDEAPSCREQGCTTDMPPENGAVHSDLYHQQRSGIGPLGRLGSKCSDRCIATDLWQKVFQNKTNKLGISIKTRLIRVERPRTHLPECCKSHLLHSNLKHSAGSSLRR